MQNSNLSIFDDLLYFQMYCLTLKCKSKELIKMFLKKCINDFSNKNVYLTDVQFRFNFNFNYYCFLIDNIKFYNSLEYLTLQYNIKHNNLLHLLFDLIIVCV